MARWCRSLLVLAACKQAPSKLDGVKPSPDQIGIAGTAIKLDGELDEPGWNVRANRGVFLGPDEDIESTDAFEVKLGDLAISARADGKVLPAIPAAIDRDGTLDKPGDDDEEWVIELAVPLARLGAAGPHDFVAKRCDTPKDRKPRCGQWAATLSLPPRR